jgi:hypothetical protein
MDERRESGHGRRFLYAGIFLVAQAALMLEILLTRITSVVSWYHLAFFVIALAMLGMTAGAVVVFVRPGWFAQAAIGRRLESSARWGAIAAPLAAAWVMATPLMPVVDLMGFVALVWGSARSGAAVRHVRGDADAGADAGRAAAGAAYGVDLVGASLGCLLVIPLLDAIDAALSGAGGGLGGGGRGVGVRAGRTDMREGAGSKGQLVTAAALVGGGGVKRDGRDAAAAAGVGEGAARGCTRATCGSAGTHTRG